MLRARRIDDRDEPIEWGGHAVTLVRRTWLVSAGGRAFRLGGWYRRPLRIEVTGPAPNRIAVRDHTMIARVAGATLFLIASMLRRIR